MKCARPCTLTIACATALCLYGCAGYRLGPTIGHPAGTKSIQLATFENRTPEPHLAEALTAALRKQIQHDGTYRLATRGEPDVVVSGQITDYYRIELSYQTTDPISVLDYRLTMTAHVLARERATGKLLLDKQVKASTLVRVGSDLAVAERQALPVLAQELAQTITGLLVDGDW